MRRSGAVVALAVLGFAQDARAFCTEWWPVECVDQGHEEATRSVRFLRDGVWGAIDQSGWAQDRGDAEGIDPRHAQYCQFEEMSDYVNVEYATAVASLDPAAPDPIAAAEAFGRLLHPIQDFYAHSNWVELLEDDYGPWNGITPDNVLDPGTGWFIDLPPIDPTMPAPIRGDILVGTVPTGGLPDNWVPSHPLDTAIPTLYVDGVPTWRALVTGWGEPDDGRGAICVDGRGDVLVDDGWGYGFRSARLTHGTNDPNFLVCQNDPSLPYCSAYKDEDDPCADGFPTSVCLNKDDPGRPHYGEALTLAGFQTQVEWCRLLNLSAETFGYDASSILMTLWADPGRDPHPDTTACAPAAPGPVQVTVTIDALSATLPPPANPADPVIGARFVTALYTGDFGQSVASEASSTEEHPSLTLCVDPTDPVLATIWGWEDIASDYSFGTGNYEPWDEVVHGTTLAIDVGQGAGVYHQATDHLDVTWRVSFDEDSGDEDTLSTCAEAWYHTSDSDPDTDDDGLWDDTEVILGTDPTRWDTDGDHIGDKWEVWDFATDALDPDTDDDCATDGVDIWNGLDPLDPDTDHDVRLDGAELAEGTDPRVADPPRDVSFACIGFGMDGGDPQPPDSDGDGLDDVFEPAFELDPGASDSDGDGLRDGIDPSWVLPRVEALGDDAIRILVVEASEKAAAGLLPDALERILAARDLTTASVDTGDAETAPERMLAAAGLDALAVNLACGETGCVDDHGGDDPDGDDQDGDDPDGDDPDGDDQDGDDPDGDDQDDDDPDGDDQDDDDQDDQCDQDDDDQGDDDDDGDHDDGGLDDQCDQDDQGDGDHGDHGGNGGNGGNGGHGGHG
ncbi:MAG: hypothetical protein ABMB14_32390, partial [Myxococcota bacterium]